MMHWASVLGSLWTLRCAISPKMRWTRCCTVRAANRWNCRSSRFSGSTMSQPFEGIINNLERRYHETNSDYMRAEIEDCMSEILCPDVSWPSPAKKRFLRSQWAV